MNRERRLFARLKKLFNSFYTPTITAVVCFVMIVLLLFNAVTFRSFYNSIRKDIYQQAYMQSQRQTMSFSMLLKEFSQLGAKIATDPNLSLSAFRKSHRNAHTAFKSYDLSFYKYDRIFIYYPGENYLLTPGGTCSPYVAFSGSDNVNLLMEEIGNCSAASGNVVRTNNKTSPELLFLYPSAQRVIIFTLKFSTISSMLTSQESISHQPSEIHMLIKHGGENNLLFCDSDIIQDFGSISEELHSGIKSNSCTEIKLENEPYLAYTDNTSYGLSVIILTKVTTQFDRLKNVMWLDVVCCVVILLLGIFVLMFSFKKTYKPIQNVVNIISGATNTPQHEGNEIDVLQNMARNYSLLLNQKNTIATLSQSKKTFLLRLINGNYTDLEVIGNLLSNLEMSFPYPYMFVCIITCASDEQPFSDDVAAFRSSREDSAQWQGYFFSTVEKGTNSS